MFKTTNKKIYKKVVKVPVKKDINRNILYILLSVIFILILKLLFFSFNDNSISIENVNNTNLKINSNSLLDDKDNKSGTSIFNTSDGERPYCIDDECGMIIDHKPVIYLYPEEKLDVKVSLKYDGELFADYPDYNYDINGWDVIAYPDSTLIDKSDNKEYSYLFWEGKPKEKIKWNYNKGFVVKGSETKKFLQDILPKIGLTPKSVKLNQVV